MSGSETDSVSNASTEGSPVVESHTARTVLTIDEMNDGIESDPVVTNGREIFFSDDRASAAPLPEGSSAIEGPSGIGSKEKRRFADEIEGDDSQEPSNRERKRAKIEICTGSSIMADAAIDAAIDACETHVIDPNADMLIVLVDVDRPFAVRAMCAHDSNALLILLDVIHGRWNSVPRHIGLELLAKSMMIVAQYKYTDALSICRDLWESAVKADLAEKPTPRNFTLWLYVVRVSDSVEEWRQVVRDAAIRCPDPIKALGIPFPEDKLRGANLAPEKAIQRLVDMVYDELNSSLSLDSGCCQVCSAASLGGLASRMHNSGLLPKKLEAPFKHVSYEYVRAVLAGLNPRFSDYPCDCYCGYMSELRKQVLEFNTHGLDYAQ
ncbi:hypothetical protein BDV19DRAFT_394245 [Aspergillus venezuelensis]